MNEYHETVLLKETVDSLKIKPRGVYVDATLGGGGHTEEMFKRCKDIRVFCFDQDINAINFSKKRLSEYSDNIVFVQENFRNFRTCLALERVNKIDGIIFDLGVSQYQLIEPTRGFSFSLDGRLDMRMDQNNPLSAEEVINSYSVDKLQEIFWNFGEERESKRIAEAIESERRKKTITNTAELSEIIEMSTKSPFKIKAKARIFMALRIYINGEIEILEKSIDDAVDALFPSGRLAIISYHSIEDRIVKHRLRYLSLDCDCPPKFPECICLKKSKVNIITRKPVSPNSEEIKANKKARSAKLRVAEKK